MKTDPEVPTTKSNYVPDKERIALAKAWQEVPLELKANPQVEGAFKTGFRLGWKAREAEPNHEN